MIDAPAKSREFAYTTWRQCGQNITETARVLKRDHNYDISRQSLHAWKDKYDWERRAAQAETEEKSRTEETSDESLLTVLLKQKKKYEEYFESLSLGTVDNQAIYAYNNILKTLLDIRERISGDNEIDIDRPKIFLEDMEFIAETLREIDPAGLKVFAGNFDEIIERYKGLNAQAT
jgi:hypothetical protein